MSATFGRTDAANNKVVRPRRSYPPGIQANLMNCPPAWSCAKLRCRVWSWGLNAMPACELCWAAGRRPGCASAADIIIMGTGAGVTSAVIATHQILFTATRNDRPGGRHGMFFRPPQTRGHVPRTFQMTASGYRSWISRRAANVLVAWIVSAYRFPRHVNSTT